MSLTTAQVAHVETTWRIPVRAGHPVQGFFLCLAQDSEMPTEVELMQLSDFRAWDIHRKAFDPALYESILKMPLPMAWGQTPKVVRKLVNGDWQRWCPPSGTAEPRFMPLGGEPLHELLSWLSSLETPEDGALVARKEDPSWRRWKTRKLLKPPAPKPRRA